MSDKIKDWEIKIMALIKKLELKAYRIGKTGNKDEESVSPNKREIVGYVQELLDKREEDIKEKIRKVGMGERWAMQAFHNGYSQAKIDILKELNK